MASDTIYSTIAGYIADGIAFTGEEVSSIYSRILLNKNNTVVLDTDTDGNIRFPSASAVAITGNVTMAGTLGVTGAATVGGTFGATGAATAASFNGLLISGSAGTLTIPTGSSFIRAGAHALTITTTGTTGVTFPTSGTLETAANVALKAPLASPTFTGTVTLPAVVNAAALPTANPGLGLLWSDGGTVKVGTA